MEKSRKYGIETFLQAESEDPNNGKIINIFHGSSSSGRTTNEMNILALEHITYNPHFDSDYSFLMDAISKSDPRNSTIICKKNAISHLNSERMNDLLEEIMDQENLEFDVLFLANWMDRCDLYSDIRNIGDSGSKIARTTSPNGDLCLMFTPRGKKKMMDSFHPEKNPIIKSQGKPLGYHLTQMISVGDIDSYAADPPFINFDMNKVTNNAEYIKGIQCREVPNIKNGGKEAVIDFEEPEEIVVSNDLSWFWFILAILLVILLAYVIYLVFAMNNNGYNKSVIKTNTTVPTSVSGSSFGKVPPSTSSLTRSTIK